MIKYLKIAVSIFSCAFILTASTCYYEEGEIIPQVEWGLKPVYSDALADLVEIQPPQPLRNPGKIYVYGDKLLVGERYKGMHVYDNSDPANPRNMFFLAIYGNVDVAIRNGVLYADQYNNLISIRINSIESDSLILNRTQDVLNGGYLDYSIYEPVESNVYYECPDPELGRVISWEQDSVEYPCYKF